MSADKGDDIPEWVASEMRRRQQQREADDRRNHTIARLSAIIPKDRPHAA